MWSDLFFTSVLVLFLVGFVWLGFIFLRQKRKERINLLTQELCKIENPKASLSTALYKTKQGFFKRLSNMLSGQMPVQSEILAELENILFSADIGVKTSQKLLDTITQGMRSGLLQNSNQIKDALRNQMQEILCSVEHKPIELTKSGVTTVVMFVGVNGVGKTTTIGKIASQLGSQGKRIVLGAGDTFRAAANEQLGIWATRSGSSLVASENSDPASVLFDAVQKGKTEKADFVLCDTAGRLHTKSNLMDELKKIYRVLVKSQAGAPHEVILVLDATMGQNAIVQAKQFSESTPLTGIVLTKLDGTAKGGIVLGIVDELKIPIRYIGVGEKVDDLHPFEAKEFINALFA
jgi:fused signal recognition particle receptor